MSSVKNLNNKITLLERKIKYGDNGGINIYGGLLEVDPSNNKVKTSSTRISFGSNAGQFAQGSFSIAIGSNAGGSNQGSFSIAIGCNAGASNQASQSIAIGRNAGASNQQIRAVAIGCNAGANTQGPAGVAIGFQAGLSGQSEGAIAIGRQAGEYNQGSSSIAIGQYAGRTGQSANSIIINASSSDVSSSTSGLFIAPIRIADVSNSLLCWNSFTKEVGSSSKTFVIDHPLDDSKYLVHACLEGPEAGVYYRGEGKIVNGESVEITLPEYTTNFYDFTVQITPINSRLVYGTSKVVNGKFKVIGDNGDFFWLVHATRQQIIVEPNKQDVTVKGDGPYTYI